MSDEPQVAVVLTCFNEGLYIGEAVQSLLEQTRADLIESIVIADDGSDPETIAVLRGIERRDPRIRVLYGSGGAGLAAQRNLAIANSSAPLLALLDGDDLWTPDKLERQIPVIATDRKIGLVYSGYFSFGLGGIGTAHRATVRDITSRADTTTAYFLNDPPIIPSTTLIRRSAFEACGRFDTAIRVFEDTDLYLRLSRVCRFAFVDAPLLYKRSHPRSITGARQDLMAYHALVAFKAAAEDHRLLPLVPRRLAERARKLGNDRFLRGNYEEARRLVRLSVRLDPFNMRAWGSMVLTSAMARPFYRFVNSRFRSRKIAIGATEPCP